MSETMTVLVASYPSQKLAEQDWQVITDLVRKDALPLDDAAVVVKDPEGKVGVVKDLHKPVRRGLLIGALVGAITPVGLILGVAGGGVAGKLKGMFHDGIDQRTLKEIGEMLEANSVVVVLAGAPVAIGAIKTTMLEATGMVEQHLGPEGHLIRQAADTADPEG